MTEIQSLLGSHLLRCVSNVSSSYLSTGEEKNFPPSSSSSSAGTDKKTTTNVQPNVLLEHTDTETIIQHTEIIATVFIEPSSAKCEEALDTLNTLVHQLQYPSVPASSSSSLSSSTPSSSTISFPNDQLSSPRLLVVLITVDRNIETLRYYLSKYPYTYGLSHDSPQQMTIARAAGLGQAVALLFPEIIFFHARTGEPLSTDGNKRIKDGLIKKETFPQCCASNCFTVRCHPLLSERLLQNKRLRKNSQNISVGMLLPSRLGPSLPYARMEENTMLRCMLYPGDSAVIRPVGKVLVDRIAASLALRTTGIANASLSLQKQARVPPTSSAIVYINAAIPNDNEFDSEDEEDEEDNDNYRHRNTSSSSSSSSSSTSITGTQINIDTLVENLLPQPNELLLSPGIMSDLGLQDGSTIALQPYLDIPTAETITVAPLRTNTYASNRLSANESTNWLLQPWFGLEHEQDERRSAILLEAMAAVRGGADEEKLALLLSNITAENTHHHRSSASASSSSLSTTESMNLDDIDNDDKNDWDRSGGPGGSSSSSSVITPIKPSHRVSNDIQQAITDANSNPYHTLSPTVHQHVNPNELSLIQSYMRTANCRYIPIATGGTIAIPVKQTTVSLDNIDTFSVAQEILFSTDYNSRFQQRRKSTSTSTTTEDLIQSVNTYYLRIGEDGYPENTGYAAYRIVETNPKFTAVIVGPDTKITCLSRST